MAPRGLQTRPDPPFPLGCFPVEFLDILVKVHSLNITVHRSQSLTVVVASAVRIVSNRIMVRERQYRYQLISGPARNLFSRSLTIYFPEPSSSSDARWQTDFRDRQPYYRPTLMHAAVAARENLRGSGSI